ncbi:MAG: hypothetical protein KVP17_001652 [Porospora cf. gigantea B]|uniref:uncharacterized protein n=1 Tax=Porospora cf. gigantea B TaxID=2853592 RepID=UPI003571C57D|nr:MAG: hypothetical protein KVP17_001652 [Porospora cf. gigantea B]
MDVTNFAGIFASLVYIFNFVTRAGSQSQTELQAQLCHYNQMNSTAIPCRWVGGDLRRPISIPQEVMSIGICLMGGPTCGRGGGGEAMREWECDQPKQLVQGEPVYVPCAPGVTNHLLLALVAAQAASLEHDLGAFFRTTCGSDWEGVSMRDSILIWSPTRKIAVLGIEGSKGIGDWSLNLQVEKIPTRLTQSTQPVHVHSGFFQNYSLLSEGLYNEVKKIPLDYKVLVCGHSLGAALAQWAAVDLIGRGILSTDLMPSNAPELLGVIAFSPPRLSDDTFQLLYHGSVGCDRTWMLGPAADVTPSLPRVWMGYRHTCPYMTVRAAERQMPSAHQISSVRNDLVEVLGSGGDFWPHFKEGCPKQKGSVKESRNVSRFDPSRLS